MTLYILSFYTYVKHQLIRTLFKAGPVADAYTNVVGKNDSSSNPFNAGRDEGGGRRYVGREGGREREFNK